MGLTWNKLPKGERRTARRRDAERRQSAHDAMPGFDKLAKIAERPGKSAKERARILAGVAA
ncbi:MAG: hypothetical protein BGN97_03555 [Microbacterium sp. 69-10]|uniref:hypothetical protein n=1 Tax=Microbacterium sp. 69-10 TaxID=1895783 RepID=UPI00095E8A18|nr:hypothetical protein [Microbacterium sp. 69-10]OJU41794.1 MAG: hypothetical protein BGN97_03555 [Microbacterium sp. 69-10]